MPKINVSVDEKVIEGCSPDVLKSQIVCTIEGNGVGPYNLYFSRSVRPEEISKALEHKALFLVDDLPRMIHADIRRSIIELHEEAAKNVPSFRERR